MNRSTPFRPFFIAAGLAAFLLIPLWLLILSGHVQWKNDLGAAGWHAHEMVFGYLGAVLAGFLLTAAKNWTGEKTVGPKGLAVLVALWVVARVLHSTNLTFPGSIAIEPLFFVGLAAAIGRAIIVAKRWRNVVFILLMVLMGVSDLLMHLALAGTVDATWLPRSLWLSIDAVALTILVFAGRVVPLFTKNALSLKSVRKKGVLDYAGLAAVAMLMVVHSFPVSPKTQSIVWASAGLLTVLRLYGWGGLRTLRTPLLWVLHVGWLLVGLGMLLVAYSLHAPTSLAPSSAQHLLFIGGFGTLTLGMMARVALGHTGRKTIASKPITLAFVLILIASGIRVAVGLAGPGLYIDLLVVAGLVWSAAFLIYLLIYVPVLLAPRADGKPG